MGEVWAARHMSLGKACAVKLMALETHESTHAALERFAREARLAAALSRKTRHIAPVTDYGIDDDGPYLVMDLLEGEALDVRIARGCTPHEVSAIVAQIAKGLGVAHREGVIHRDLKPANVFLARSEEGELLVKLLDFGIARLVTPTARALTLHGVVVGSPGYMSPEHVLGEMLDTRADVWALAVVAFEALTGVLPFGGESIDGTMNRIRAFEARSLRSILPEASTALEAVFTRAFAPNIAERFQSADELSHALSRASGFTSPHAEADIEVPTAIPTRRRRWTRVALAAGVCGIALGIGAILYTPPEPSHASKHELVVQAPAPTMVPAAQGDPSVSSPPADAINPPPSTHPLLAATVAKPSVVDPSTIF